MNDVHGVEKPWNIRTNRFWYEHPELHRCPEHDRLKDGGKYNNLHALDYSKPAVQEFEFGIFKELVTATTPRASSSTSCGSGKI